MSDTKVNAKVTVTNVDTGCMELVLIVIAIVLMTTCSAVKEIRDHLKSQPAETTP